MSTLEESKTKPRRAPSDQALAQLRAIVREKIGVRIDLDRLDQSELDELWDLWQVVTKRSGWEESARLRFSLSRLSTKELAQWQELIAKAAGEPGLFARAREDESLRKRLVDLAARPRPLERPLQEEPGSVRLSQDVVFNWLVPGDSVLEIPDLGVLVLVLGQLVNGRSVLPGGQVEGERAERTLVASSGSFSKFNTSGLMFDTAGRLRHLTKCGLLTFVEQGGGKWRIGFGPLTSPEESTS